MALIIILAVTSVCFLTSQNKVGIGVTNPAEKLEVAGKVFSNQGGFKFPDNTVQITAAYNTETSDAALPKLLGLLRVPGISGPRSQSLHFKDGSPSIGEIDLIPVYAHNLEVGNDGTVTFGPLHITSDISIATPDLFQAVASGLVLARATLFLLEDGAISDLVYSTIEITTVNITLYSHNQIYQGDFHYAHLNSFAFDFETIEITTYTTTGKITYCWDRSGNSPC